MSDEKKTTDERVYAIAETMREHISLMTWPNSYGASNRPPETPQDDPWKDTKEAVFLMDNTVTAKYYWGLILTARAATDAAHRAEVERLTEALTEVAKERDVFVANRQRVRDSFGHRDADGKCQCVYCRQDAEGLEEHAADCEMQCFSHEQTIARLTEEREALQSQLEVSETNAANNELALGMRITGLEAERETLRQALLVFILEHEDADRLGRSKRCDLCAAVKQARAALTATQEQK